MAQDTLLGFPAHTLPYRCGKFNTFSTVSQVSLCKSKAPECKHIPEQLP